MQALVVKSNVTDQLWCEEESEGVRNEVGYTYITYILYFSDTVIFVEV